MKLNRFFRLGVTLDHGPCRFLFSSSLGTSSNSQSTCHQLFPVFFTHSHSIADTMGAGEWGSEEGHKPRNSGDGCPSNPATGEPLRLNC